MTQILVTIAFVIVMIANVIALRRHWQMMRALEIALNGMAETQREFDEMMRREKINSPPLDPTGTGTSSL